MQRLKGRTVWVTGAGSGIGRATALAFAQEGAQVALSGRRADALADTAADIGQDAMVLPADLTDPAQVEQAHGLIVSTWGAVDILVNNAGNNAKRRHWRDLSIADMTSIMDVNLKAPFLCTMAVLPGMRARKAGLLIHIASLAGTMLFPVSGPTYTAAKHGARAMSATINAEEGIHGIRSVCINPGEVATEMLDSRPKPPSTAERAMLIQPEDIAAAAVFAAMMPPRTCIADMTIVPTDSQFWRATARSIAEG
jgi:NADP-dependent 3-hydroxy acid dehydrogenase YdfG